MNEQATKRDAILDAANTVTAEWGASAMSLDAVAKQAGVSKGGLLYHFPNKEALIQGMLERLIHNFDEALEAEIEREAATGDAPVQGRWLRAYIRLNTEPQDDLEAVTYSLLAAVSTSPKLLQPVQEAFVRWQQRAESDGLSVEVATLIRLAADGCSFCRLFGFGAGLDNTAQLPALRQELLGLVERAITSGAETTSSE